MFREELRNKGVMEFYLWGKAELEDMLHLPKNDRILFTFFGISLVSRRRKRTTDIRSAVSVKNKLYRIVDERYQFHQSILIRDLKDTHYPYEDEYKDFKTRPRWKEYVAFEHHPLGLWCHNHRYFAYIDREKKEWDFTEEVDLVHRNRENMEKRQHRIEKQDLVEGVWDYFPRKNKGHFIIDCLVKYSDIAAIDDKGDVLFNFPHLYVDFVGNKGPFLGCRNVLEINKKEIDLTDDYKRICVFPKKFKKVPVEKIYQDKKITLNEECLKEFKKHNVDTLYETDDKYSFLEPKDVILIDKQDVADEEIFIQITYKFKTKAKDHIDQTIEPFRTKRNIELQLQRAPKDNEEINIYEFKKVYNWQLEKSKNK